MTVKLTILLVILSVSHPPNINGKVIKTNTKLSLLVKNTDPNANQTTAELISSNNMLTKLSSNEIDPNVHPIESSNPPLSDEPQIPITNEVIPESPGVSDNLEVNSDVNPSPETDLTETDQVNTDDPNPINKYCKCSEFSCDCCRMFSLPLLPVRAPTCARIRYLGEEKMSIQLKYGDVVLVTRTVSGKKATPICLPLPGGYNQFCGRVYGLSRGKNDFKACLGFELRAEDEVEAQLRVSCFRFGAQGFAVSEAEPLPPENEKEEDDEDDDFFGFGGDDEDEDDADSANDDDDDGIGLFDDDDYDGDDADDYPTEQDETPDYGGFSILENLFSGGSSKKLKNTNTLSKSSKSVNGTLESDKSNRNQDSLENKEDETNGVTSTPDSDDDDKDNEEDDDEEDDDEDEDDDETDDEKNEDDDKNKEDSFSTLDYFLGFVTKLVKLF